MKTRVCIKRYILGHIPEIENPERTYFLSSFNKNFVPNPNKLCSPKNGKFEHCCLKDAEISFFFRQNKIYSPKLRFYPFHIPYVQSDTYSDIDSNINYIFIFWVISRQNNASIVNNFLS